MTTINPYPSTVYAPSDANRQQDAANLKDALWNNVASQPWGQAFWQDLEAAHVPEALAGQGTVTPQTDTYLYSNMTPDQQQQAKNLLYNVVQASPLGTEAWDDLYQANLVPGTQAGASVNAGSAGSAGSTGSTAGAGQVAGNTDPNAGGTGGAQVSVATGQTSGVSTGTTVVSSGTVAASAGTTAVSTAVVASTSTGGATSSVRADLEAALTPQMGQTSGRFIGRAGMADSWSDAQIASLQRGIQTAQQFFPNMSPEDLQHMIIAEGSQESSGDVNLNVGGDAGAGQGFMQVTPQSVLKDYESFGTPIKAPDGSTVVSPSSAINLSDPAQNVALWAWYSRNVVSAGQSLDEDLQWHNAPSPVTRDFGNVQYDWFAGPHNDRFTNPGPDQDYNNRIRDYFVQAGFGTVDQFDALLNTPISSNLMDVQ